MYVLPDAAALSAAEVVASVVICDAVVATVVFSTTAAVSAWFVLSLLDLLNSLIWIFALSNFLLFV